MSEDLLSQYPSISEITKRMVNAMQTGSYEEALPLLNTLIAREPSDAPMLFSRGLAYYQLKRHQDALDDFNRAHASGLADTDLFVMRARTHVLLHQFEDALADLHSAASLKPSVMVYQTRAAIYEMLGQYALALADYDAAIALEPTNGELYHLRARRHASFNTSASTVSALADADAAIAYGYLRPDTYLLRGQLHQAAGNTEQALNDYAEAIALDRRSANAYRVRAALLATLERYNDALTDLDMALRIETQPADLLLRGKLLLLRGEPDDVIKARQTFAEVLKTQPDHPQALCGRALAYMRQNKPDRAEVDFYAFVSQSDITHDEERAGIAWLILALAQQGKWDDAQQQIALMQEAYPELANADAMAQQEGWNAQQQSLYQQAWGL